MTWLVRSQARPHVRPVTEQDILDARARKRARRRARRIRNAVYLAVAVVAFGLGTLCGLVLQ